MLGTIGPVTRPSDSGGSEALDSFEWMPCGGILLDEYGRVLHLDARAHHCSDSRLTLADQHIRTQCDSADHTLQDLISAALQPRDKGAKRAGQALLLPRPGARPLTVRVLRTAD